MPFSRKVAFIYISHQNSEFWFFSILVVVEKVVRQIMHTFYF